MKNFVDRMPTKANRYKLTEDDGAVRFATVERADEPTTVGTPMNRKALMAVQGFQGKTTEFKPNGNIVETNTEGDILETVFQADGSIREVFASVGGLRMEKTTTFQADGIILEGIS